MASQETQNPGAFIRPGTRADLKELTRMLTRSFARDPMENWFGNVRKMVSSADTQDKAELDTLRRLSYFQECMTRRCLLCGQIDVVVVKEDSGEKIVATTIWIEPGKDVDPPALQLPKLRAHKILQGWGFRGVKRILGTYMPRVERVNKKVFSSKGKRTQDAWHLLVVATDPAYEGRGYVSLMMRERFKTTAPLPIHLESSSPRSREVYKHFGFEIDEELVFSRGSVDADGVKAKGEKATGVSSWVMTKWTY